MDHLCYLCLVFVMLSHLFIAPFGPPAGKGLTSLHLFVMFNYPQVFLKKRMGYCYRLRPSVRPLCYLLLNHWTKFNQIYSHVWGVQRQPFFCPAPWGPGEGSKGHISFNFNYIVNFKDFYTKLCVCSNK